MRPADHGKSGEENGHLDVSLSVNELLALHDPTFPDMYEWLTSSTKNDLKEQHYPQNLSTPIAEASSTLHNDTTADEEKDDDILETVATTPLEKRSPSPSMSQHDSSKDDGPHYQHVLSSPIAEVPNTLLDIEAVAEMDVDTPEIVDTPKVSPSPPIVSSPIAEVSNTLLDIEAVAKMDVDTPEIVDTPKIAPLPPNVFWQDSVKQLHVRATASPEVRRRSVAD
jgi:hypothetical protein